MLGADRLIRLAWGIGFAISCTCGSGVARAQDPAIDGLFDEWIGIAAIATDPAGDASGPLDLTALRATSRGTEVFVQIDLANTLNLSSGPASDPTLRMIVTRDPQTLTIDFRGRVAYLDGNPGHVVAWPSFGFACLPTTASGRFEMRIDGAIIGANVGEQVQFAFTGADTLAANAPFTLVGAATPPIRRNAVRSPCTTLRVASFNTFFTGLADAARRSAFVRLLDAVDADVYCFQEEYDSTEAQVRSVLLEADPLENGSAWNVLKAGELAIASPYPLVSVTLGSAYLAAVVRPPGGVDTLVITDHLKCCGYAGNIDDSLRINQTTSAVQAFNSFRNGTLSPPLAGYKDVPAIMVGDMNLVGSSTPLNLWLASPGPALSHIRPRHLIGGDAWTWSSPDGLGFWPGALDIAAYDAARVALADSFLLHSSELTNAECSALGIQPGDSTASDHLLVVLDFGTGSACDTNCDGSVNLFDIESFVSLLGGQTSGCSICAGDSNGDGSINLFDIAGFVDCLSE